MGHEAKVVLVEVIDSVQQIIAQTTPAGFEFGAGILDSATLESMLSAQRQAAQAHLDAARASLLMGGLPDVDTVILEGHPGQEIVRLVTGDGFDVVVMGTHGRSGLFRTVLGSVAEYVVRHVRGVPVLLIHPDSAQVAHGEGAVKAAAAAPVVVSS